MNRKHLFIIIMSIVALYSITWLELLVQKKPSLIGGGINRTMLLLLINAHIICTILLLYLIIKHSLKLFMERQKGVPGSVFKRNLLFAFVLFSVIPSLFVFFVAGKFITKSIDRWFSSHVMTGFESAFKLHEQTTQTLRNQIKQAGHNFFITKTIPNKEFTPYIWTTSGMPVLGSLQDEIKIWRSLRVHNDRSIKSLRKTFWPHIKENQEVVFDFYGSLYWVKSHQDRLYVLVYRYPIQEATYLIALQNAHNDYQHTFFIKNTLYINYFFTFLMITILILFLSIWCAFYLARGISKPIQELLDATGKISKGELSTHIETNPSDDLFLLAQGFNHMTKALHIAQSRLEQKNYEMITILENLSASVLFINHFGRITFHNNATQKFITQWIGNIPILNKKINIFGKDIGALCFAIIRELKTTKKTHIVKQIMLPLQQQNRILTFYCSFITHTNADQSGKDGLLLVIEDITDLIKINKLKIWQEAAKQMAHEIKNPLTPIQLATQRLQRKFGPSLPNDQSFYEITNTILSQVHVIKNLVSHFSAFASLPSPIIQRFDLIALIDELLHFYQESFVHISFIKTNFSQDLYINTDKEKLRRVFINLLDNSIRALHTTTEKPTIIINLESCADQEISILFQDNGPGINPAVKETLFLPYVSTEKKNMGLGLAIVHDIIVQLGGSISLLQTQLGASFLITLPR